MTHLYVSRSCPTLNRIAGGQEYTVALRGEVTGALPVGESTRRLPDVETITRGIDTTLIIDLPGRVTATAAMPAKATPEHVIARVPAPRVNDRAEVSAELKRPAAEDPPIFRSVAAALGFPLFPLPCATEEADTRA